MRNGIKWLPVFLSILLLIAGLASAEEAVPMDFQTLQPGDAGEQVTLLQQKLADAGYLEAASGVYDEATEQAVLRLQQNYGLEETGVADIETQEVIFGGCYLVLEEGMSGPKVAALQERLKSLSLFSDEADGVFGLTTKQSVEIFQQLYSIPVTGIADVETLTQLFSDLSERDILVAPTPSPTPGINSQNEPFKKKLSYGSTSASVKKLQERLMELGYFTYKKTTTGFYKNTQQAVKDFQKNNGLKVTGTVDKETWDAIFNDDQVVTASQTPRPSPTPAPQQYYMDVDVANQVTRVYTYDENNEYTKLVRVMICSTGRSKYPSPTGVITLPGRKARWCTFPNWGGGTAMYWTKIDENVAFHSILYANYDPDRPNMSSFNNLGKRASHGCIRLHTMDAKWVYDNIGAGTKVYIHNDSTTDKELVAFARYRKGNAEDTVIPESEYDPNTVPSLTRTLNSGRYGKDVFWVQMTLKKLGYLTDTWATGYYGPLTVASVKKFQKDNGLKQDGTVSTKTMTALTARLDSFLHPTPTPTVVPTPTPKPTPTPTAVPTAEPTAAPAEETTVEPVEEPTEEPVEEPTEEPKHFTFSGQNEA